MVGLSRQVTRAAQRGHKGAYLAMVRRTVKQKATTMAKQAVEPYEDMCTGFLGMGLSMRPFQYIYDDWNFKQQDEWNANQEHTAAMKSEFLQLTNEFISSHGDVSSARQN
jgi:hypothetical protein